MPADAQQPTGAGRWDCDCGRECRPPGELPGCRAEWVDEVLPPWTEAETAKYRAQALRGDLRQAARLLREHGYTVTEPANV
jgi:hypothetical protein